MEYKQKQLLEYIKFSLKSEPEKVLQKMGEFENFNFKTDGISPLLAFAMNKQAENIDLFAVCFNKTSMEYYKEDYHSLLYHSIYNQHIKYLEILLQLKELYSENFCYRLIHDYIDDLQDRMYLVQLTDTPELIPELVCLERAVKDNNCKKVEETLQQLQVKCDLNEILNSEINYIKSLLSDRLISCEMMEIFSRYIDMNKETYIECYDENMSMYDYFKKSSEDVWVDLEARERYASYVALLDDIQKQKKAEENKMGM